MLQCHQLEIIFVNSKKCTQAFERLILFLKMLRRVLAATETDVKSLVIKQAADFIKDFNPQDISSKTMLKN